MISRGILPSVMDHASNQPGPSTLMGGTKTSSSVAIKELMVPEVVLPMLIKVKAVVASIYATSAIILSGKQVLQPVLDLFRNLAEMHIITAASRAFHLKFMAVEEEESLQRFNEEKVDTKPDWASPVAVSTKQTTVGIPRNIANLERLAVHIHGEGIFLVELGQRSDSVVAEEFVLVKHALENLFEPVLANNRQQDSVSLASLLNTCHVPLGKVTTMLHEPFDSFLERWKSVDELGFKSRRGIQRNQSD